MKARKIGFCEIENRIREVVIELERMPMDDKLVLEKAGELSFLLSLCIGQMSDCVKTPPAILRSHGEWLHFGISTKLLAPRDSDARKFRDFEGATAHLRVFTQPVLGRDISQLARVSAVFDS